MTPEQKLAAEKLIAEWNDAYSEESGLDVAVEMVKFLQELIDAPQSPAVQNGYTPFYVYKLNYFDNGLDSIDDLPWEYCYSKDDLYRARMLVVPVKTRNNK